jgi:serine/threonine protein kinase
VSGDLERRVQQHLGTTHSLEFELGGGGMSRVFVAEDKSLNRRVVVKVLNPSVAATFSVARFQREIMVVAKMNHPNIVPVLSAGEVDGLPFFIMPYIEGESLRGRIVRGPLSLRETVGILKDVMRALAYAHSMGVVHRDMKPDNILLSGSAAVVTDFGVAKAVSAARNKGVIKEGGQTHGNTITGVGISLGTPQYMAPEQAAADPNADHRVDLYAMGIVAYEMLVGSPPFHGRSPQALLAAQLTELPPPLASRRYDVPVTLADMVMQCLEKDPADRPRNASDLVRLLDAPDVLSGPIAATPDARAKRRWRWWTTAVGTTLTVAAFVAIVMWSLWPSTPDAPVAPAVTVDSRPIVRVAPAASIGAESAAPAAALSAAIETALVRDGVRVMTGAAAADSNSLTIETTLQRVGRRARAQVRMSSADASTAVWADQVDFEIADSFAAQDTIAARVVRAVRAARSSR